MARYGQRPENALKRANEFIEVGKPARALDTLQEVFRNKKWIFNLSESILEPIMFKFLELCVDLRKPHIAKEGLFQYRNMFQSVNVGSLDKVIRGYIRMAEEKTDAARKQSQQAVIDIDDLDNLATPESVLLSAVSGEDAQDRSDRTILTPWVKFRWEVYCQCLELLKTNAYVEMLYHEICRMAFQFCLEYNRKTEFRKLCEKLRKHFEDRSKLPPLASNVSMSKLETQQLNLETRLNQLDYAMQMDLWQEAYKAIEDNHGLMNSSEKMPVPKTMANYYQKLGMVFWKAGNNLFHAAALFKLLQLTRDMKKNMSPDEQQRMANRVLLATLSIPLPSANPEYERFIETDKAPQEKVQKLTVLLGLNKPPTRASLLKDIVRLNILNLAAPFLQDLYSWLEVEFQPLELCSRVDSVTKNLLSDDTSPLVQYIPALQDLTLVRLVHQLSQIYVTIQFTRILELAKFTDRFHLESLLVDCVRYNNMQLRIDHGKNSIHFGVDLSEAQREDHPDGPVLQAMPSEQIRCQLVNMATVLHRAINIINPNVQKQARDKLRRDMVNIYHETKVKEHQKVLGRQKIIEERKEYIEHINNVREEEELRRQEQLHREHVLAEKKRIELEREERERKRQQSEIQQIKDRHLKEKMQQISQTSHGQKVLKKLDDEEIKTLDAEQIAAREAEELLKERREMQQKLKSQEKKVDHLERAKRIEEIPLLEKAVVQKEELAKQRWEQQEAERIQAAIEEREQSVATRERLEKMKEDADVFANKILEERKNIYIKKLADFEQILNEKRIKRLEIRKMERKAERKIQWQKECAEAIERERLEEIRLRQEEERKRLEEERAKTEMEEAIRRAEEAKENERREKQAEIARQREADIERKLEEERLKSMERPVSSANWRSKKLSERETTGVQAEKVSDREKLPRPTGDRDQERAPERDRGAVDRSWRGPRDDAPKDRNRRYDDKEDIRRKRPEGFDRERRDYGNDQDSRKYSKGRTDGDRSWQDSNRYRPSDYRRDDRPSERRGFRATDDSRSMNNWRNAGAAKEEPKDDRNASSETRGKRIEDSSFSR